MIGARLSAYRDRVREALEAAFSENLPPTDVAASFAFGVGVAALPNFGLALVAFAALAYHVERVSNLALLAAGVVMNLVKGAVFAASIWLGSLILGPAPGAASSALSPSVGPAVLLRLFVGNVLIAAVVSVAGYVAALRFVRELRRRDAEPVDALPDATSGETR